MDRSGLKGGIGGGEGDLEECGSEGARNKGQVGGWEREEAVN